MSCASFMCISCMFVFFFKQKTAYVMRISDCSSDVCSSDLMLIALIFHGVAFEFRFKATRAKRFWGAAFALGSILAAFAQGLILGALVEGMPLTDGKYLRSEERRVGKECGSTCRSRW